MLATYSSTTVHSANVAPTRAQYAFRLKFQVVTPVVLQVETLCQLARERQALQVERESLGSDRTALEQQRCVNDCQLERRKH